MNAELISAIATTPIPRLADYDKGEWVSSLIQFRPTAVLMAVLNAIKAGQVRPAPGVFDAILDELKARQGTR